MNKPSANRAGQQHARAAAVRASLERLRDLAKTGGRTLGFVFGIEPRLLVIRVALALICAGLPIAIAWVGKQLVDSVAATFFTGALGQVPSPYAPEEQRPLAWLAAELGLVLLLRVAERGQSLSEMLLRPLVAQRVNESILEKAVSLSLGDFEDPTVTDRMGRARRGASSRPLRFATSLMHIGQNALSLFAYALLLFGLSKVALLLLIASALPLFVAETRFSQDAFRLFRWRAPETRRQNYYEMVLARPEYAKEVKLFGLGDYFLGKYRAIFDAHHETDRRRTVQQTGIALSLATFSVLCFYGVYAWVVNETSKGRLTFGDMTMYVLVFRQAQGALRSLLGHIQRDYEDLLYVSELFAFLDHPSGSRGRRGRDVEATPASTDAAPDSQGTGMISGETPSDGLRFIDVAFRYPGAEQDVLSGINLHISPGRKLALVGENGAGKTTLIKLMTGLYQPTRGRILLDGTDLHAWDQGVLLKRFGVIFQDFIQYQTLVGENIGVGDVDFIDEESRWKKAAKKGLADAVIERLEKEAAELAAENAEQA